MAREQNWLEWQGEKNSSKRPVFEVNKKIKRGVAFPLFVNDCKVRLYRQTLLIQAAVTYLGRAFLLATINSILGARKIIANVYFLGNEIAFSLSSFSSQDRQSN